MRLEARKYLYDIQEAAALAAQFTAGKNFEEYARDAMLRMAVERAFAIIGEAMAQLARIDSALAEKITNLKNIIAFRNVLVHAYAQIDNRIVWGIVESELPILILEVTALMNAEDEM